MLRTMETYTQSTHVANLSMAEIQVYLKLWFWSSDNNVIKQVQIEEHYLALQCSLQRGLSPGL